MRITATAVFVLSILVVLTTSSARSLAGRTGGSSEAYVVAGSIVVTTPNLPTQAKEEILYGTLLAQLAADKQKDCQQDPTEWYKF